MDKKELARKLNNKRIIDVHLYDSHLWPDRICIESIILDNGLKIELSGCSGDTYIELIEIM